MKHTYRVKAEEICDEEGGSHTVFGIAAVNAQGGTDASFSDVFTDKDEVTRFVDLCNRLELNLIHLSDVVEDVLN